MKKLHEKEEVEAMIEFEKLPPKLQTAHVNYMRALSNPESSKMLSSVENHPDRDELIAVAAKNGNTGAMLLLAKHYASIDDWPMAQYWSQCAYESGSAEAAFVLGLTYLDSKPQMAYQFLKAAFHRGHVISTYALVNLCLNSSPLALEITDVEMAETLTAATELGDKIQFTEAYASLITGTHPVQFLNEAGIPWGTGTFFLVDWKEGHFAITASHVITAAHAKPDEVQLLVPGQDKPMPFVKEYMADLRDASGQPLDLHAWKIDRVQPTDVEWLAWNLNVYWKPASELVPGQTIFVTGYPNTEDKIDYENRVMRRQPLIVRGKLGSEMVAGLHPVECAEFSTDVDGISGSPVFAMFGGMFFFVGMAQLGGTSARRLHFLDAADIVQALDALT